MIKAEILCDSINTAVGSRLTTFKARFPRIVLAELNTHRAFSRNSASSRAIPFEKMLEMVKNDPFIPIKFQKDHKGMQGTEYFEGEEHKDCVADWLNARDKAVEAATSFLHPVTKQIRNRLLEPFMWHTAIITSTDYGNFTGLRAHNDAEIHIADLAYKMLDEYNKSEPQRLNPGDWHVPFGDKIDESRMFEVMGDKEYVEAHKGDNSYFLKEDFKRRVAVARCGRISYNNFEGKDDYAADIKMCDRLFGSIPRHLSPAEHVAQAIEENKYIGNFRGFKQIRKFFLDENLKDDRIIQK